VANGLFDVLAFPQAPYIFFFVAAVAVVAAAPEPAATPVRTSASPGVRPLPA
jgi:hypothetical protein